MDYERLMNKKNSNGKDAVDLLNEATDIMDKDDFKGAIDLLSEAVDLCGHPRLYFNLGYCYYQLRDYKNAIVDFENSLANDRGTDLLKHERQRLFLYLGIIYEKNNDNDKAIEAYKNSADWGYEGALGKLENLGVPYIPDEPKMEPFVSKAAQTNQRAQAKQNTQQKQRAQQKPRAQADKPAAVSSAKKRIPGFIVPAAVGIIVGFFLFIMIDGLSKREVSAKPSVIRATVTSSTLDLRAEPFTYSELLKVLYKDSVVEVTGDASGDWTPVVHEGVRGWVDSQRIEK
ncbi:MAG: tetratricopeptide repeat protein [Treponema sp.]|nr:tetratricopeptide repeat protein [Treponema sp.]MCL2237773.1 tetratricopeptide repeat protein [Treponema sp.]